MRRGPRGRRVSFRRRARLDQKGQQDDPPGGGEGVREDITQNPPAKGAALRRGRRGAGDEGHRQSDYQNHQSGGNDRLCLELRPRYQKAGSAVAEAYSDERETLATGQAKDDGFLRRAEPSRYGHYPRNHARGEHYPGTVAGTDVLRPPKHLHPRSAGGSIASIKRAHVAVRLRFQGDGKPGVEAPAL